MSESNTIDVRYVYATEIAYCVGLMTHALGALTELEVHERLGIGDTLAELANSIERLAESSEQLMNDAERS